MATPQTTSEKSNAQSKKTPDAVEILKADHRKVEALFEEFESSKRKDRKEKVALEICDELSLHAAVEEEALYPPAKKALGEEDAELVAEAIVEHSSLKWLIQQIIDEEPGSELYDAKVIVLKEYVSHHVKEEEKELFPKLKKSDLDLKAIGEEIVALKSSLTSKRIKH